MNNIKELMDTQPMNIQVPVFHATYSQLVSEERESRMRGVNSPSRCHEKGIRVTMNAMKENAENA
jgi:hypothetical protein